MLPLFDKTPQRVLASLENQNIVVARFEEAFPKVDLAIDFARLERRRPKVGVEYPPPSQKQQKDKDVHGYKCEDRLRFTGEKRRKRSNLIWLNDKRIRVPNNEMLLLLYLVIELKKGKGGWTTSKQLCDEHITDQDIPQRSIGRLRDRLAIGLLDGDREKFVENDDEGSYRISTHPDFVILPDKNWLVTEFNEVREAVARERKKRESDRRRREEEEIKRALSKQK